MIFRIRQSFSIWALLLLSIFTVFLFASCGGGGSSGGGYYWGDGGSGTAATPQISGVTNLNSTGQPVRSGDWCEITGSGFGSSQVESGATSYALFTFSGGGQAQAQSYGAWSDTSVTCLVPASKNVMTARDSISIAIVSASGSSSGTSPAVQILYNPTPNPSPAPTPPTPTISPSPTQSVSPTPSPTASVSPTPSPSATPASETWILQGYALGKDAGNETGGAGMADIVYFSSGVYRMYYGHSATRSIKYAESTNAINWTVKGTCVTPTDDASARDYTVSGPSVLKLTDGRYRMYYQAGAYMAPGGTAKYQVRSAISNDGVTFTKEGVRIDISPYDSSAVLQLAGHGTYFYATNGKVVGIFSGEFTGTSGPSDLIMSTSSDGLTFGNFTKLYDDWHDPIVILANGQYQMYSTYLLEKQGLAYSTDGVTWPSQQPTTIYMKNSSGTVLTEGNSGVGDIAGVLLTTGSVMLYTNYGALSSENIVYFQKQ
ncbi:MAG: hypothetical protein RDV48_24990 [Candidatus Eremiobacteraeota bacterium]|nr:hypothetical protein [Candidatus Eremiobacteraeota bacterium]